MNVALTQNEINAIAEQIATSVLARLDAAARQASKTTSPTGLLTVKDVADQLQLSEKTIHKYLADARLRGSNIGTSEKPLWRITQQAIQVFLES